MTDPTLAALLADPTARLVAADRAQEVGEELTEALLRWAASTNQHCKEEIGIGRRYLLRVYCGPWPTIYVDANPVAGYRFKPGQGWTRYDGSSHYTRCTPPPGLEAVVLTVLRRRLLEVQHEAH